MDCTIQDLLKPCPTFQSVSATERPALFVRKLRLCCVLFEWEFLDEQQMPSSDTFDPEEQKAKDVKRQLLLELVDFVGKNRSFLNEAIVVEILRMISTNLFRALPQQVPPSGVHPDPDDEDPVFEPAWSHLQIVYEFFLRFLVSNDLDSRMLKRHINGPYVLHILDLFDSDDPRERGTFFIFMFSVLLSHFFFFFSSTVRFPCPSLTLFLLLVFHSPFLP